MNNVVKINKATTLNDYYSVLDILAEDTHLVTDIDSDNLVQKIYIVNNDQAIAKMPENFIRTFKIKQGCVIGVETIPRNSILGTHTDFPPRKSNLLINISDGAVELLHSNNGTLVEKTVEPLGTLLVDVTKPHGCRREYEFDAKFLSINYQLSYQETIAYLAIT